MSSYTSNLKTWGAQGQEYPDGYSYIEGEQPVDAWDNYLTDNIIDDLQHLITLTNDRLETDSGSSHPTSPEPGHLSHRTDGVVTNKQELFFYDSSDSVWSRLLRADGDKMTGVLDMGGYHIEDTSGSLTLDGRVEAGGSLLDTQWFQKQEGGTVADGGLVVIGQFGLEDGETLEVTQAVLSKDGFTTPCVSGLDLIIADDTDSTTTILSGDGTTLYDNETGTPHTSYTNSSGSHRTVIIGLDNGHYNTGSGIENTAYGGYIARVV